MYHNYHHNSFYPCLHCHPHTYIRMCGESYKRRIKTSFDLISMQYLPTGLSLRVGIISKEHQGLQGGDGGCRTEGKHNIELIL
ncbi:hypothetical protein EZV62_017584 [Acer yangbiense]|uniref:Uncharacterized protein n=1 Tax=Acer yangbiense TaxID=1000413 RepID=A0A5C7HH01_9ROSI|nr:hypothetical protein EZV62_017584 [Acer yangbiense]